MPSPESNKTKAVLAAVAAVVAGLSVSLWQAVRATHAERAARDNAALAVTERNQAVEARSAADRERAHAERHLYFANMYLLQIPWEQNNLGRVRQLLDETATSPQRGFEWYYWQRQAHLELLTLRGHLGAVLAVAFSPDGQRLVTGSRDGTAKVWEAASGKELLTLKGHSSAIRSVAFSPDSQRIISGSDDHAAKVWEAASGKELLTFKGHRYAVSSVAFSPDSLGIVTGSEDGTAKVWEAATPAQVVRWQAEEQAAAERLAAERRHPGQ